MATTLTDRAVKILDGFANPNFSFWPGQVVKFVNGDRVPATIAQNSEPYEGPIPHDATVFDAAAWEAANKPRVEPKAPAMLSDDDVRRRFDWTREQFGQACGTLGFPKRHSYRLSKSTITGLGLLKGGWHDTEEAAVETSLWQPVDVDRWEAAVRSLFRLKPLR